MDRLRRVNKKLLQWNSNRNKLQLALVDHKERVNESWSLALFGLNNLSSGHISTILPKQCILSCKTTKYYSFVHQTLDAREPDGTEYWIYNLQVSNAAKECVTESLSVHFNNQRSICRSHVSSSTAQKGKAIHCLTKTRILMEFEWVMVGSDFFFLSPFTFFAYVSYLCYRQHGKSQQHDLMSLPS